jgi:hypothetical protein
VSSRCDNKLASVQLHFWSLVSKLHTALHSQNCYPRHFQIGAHLDKRSHTEPDRQCTYNVTDRRVLATAVALEKQYVVHIVCSLRYPACMRIRHIVICGLLPLQYFTNYLTKGAILWKKVIEHQTFFFIFSITFVLNISHPKKNWTRSDQKCLGVFT